MLWVDMSIKSLFFLLKKKKKKKKKSQFLINFVID